MLVRGGLRGGHELGRASISGEDSCFGAQTNEPWVPQSGGPRAGGVPFRGEQIQGSAGPVAVLEADRKPDGQLRQDNVFRYVIATS